MSDIQWPSVLPYPSSYASMEARPVLRTAMDSGRTRQRLRFPGADRAYSVAWVFTQLEAFVFREFFRYHTESGTLWFDLPVVGEFNEVELKRVRFVGGTYREQYRPHQTWSVTVTLEEDTSLATSNGGAGAALIFSNLQVDAFFFSSNALHSLIHLTLPEDL